MLRHGQAVVIPRAGRVAHVQENRPAAELHLPTSVLAALDATFPRPAQRLPLEML